MNIEQRDQFITLWRRYFDSAELPLACYYAGSDRGASVVKRPQGHSCLLAQLLPARRGESLCFTSDSIGCGGGKKYLGFADNINERFEYFLSNGEDGGFCEKYKQSPDLVRAFINQIPRQQKAGDYLIFKRWDKLEEKDIPEVVIFFATPDVISGLFTWTTFDTNAADAVIAPFGAGCASIVYYPYMEHISNRERAVMGLFDPSARKCVKGDLLSFALPINKFMKMVHEMEESFLTTPSWEIIRKRISAEQAGH